MRAMVVLSFFCLRELITYLRVNWMNLIGEKGTRRGRKETESGEKWSLHQLFVFSRRLIGSGSESSSLERERESDE